MINKIKKIFQRQVERPLRIQSTSFLNMTSDPEGAFSFYAGERALVYMEEKFGLNFEELSVLVLRVFQKCSDLGFIEDRPINFMLDVQDMKRDPCWVVTKIQPPITMKRGELVSRSVTIFIPSLEVSLKQTEGLLKLVARLGGLPSDRAPGIIKRAIDVKNQMAFTHELIHVFATDEYKRIMSLLGLEKLELLTDAINVVTFYEDYKDSNEFTKMGFAEGSGYMTNLLMKEDSKNVSASKTFERSYLRSKMVISECQSLFSQR